MKGDFTRFSFDAARHYTRVLKQQGRVELDADWNEQGAIQEHLDRTTRRDVVGRNGAPKADAGFAVTLAANHADLLLGPGRLYADGLLCELEGPSSYATQPYLPDPGPLARGNETAGRRDLVYLDVWQRHVTALEDGALREVALGGPDTATRLQTVWQVRLLRDFAGDCKQVDVWAPPASGARLTTAVDAPPPSATPCDIPPLGGYRGLENRLYRVEVHDGGALGTATWKWSRDNGSVAFAVEEFPATAPDRVRVRRLGRDQVLTLRVDDWVEVLDDHSELVGGGTLARVTAVDAASRLVTLDRDLPAGAFSPARHARIRRWDQQAGVDAGGVLATAAGPIELEDGVRVEFDGSGFQPGDYWVFAARTATREVEPLVQAPPRGIRHAYGPLALLTWQDAGGGTLVPQVEDCRPLFPPLTAITADDVSFDNGACKLVDAETVQDALERLCAGQDLRWHNRHLHGWGIVCGLQVHCGADVASEERRQVTVQTGYAIDCEGRDIRLDEAAPLDVMAAIAALDQESPDSPVLDEKGDGEVCLLLELDEKHATRFAFERYTPEKKGWQSLLQGTLLLDFYHHCIEKVVDWVRGEFTPGPEEEKQLVGPTQKRLATLLNLLIQLWNPTNGRFVYLSRREHEILESFYDGLRALLQSRTFCAMFENARPFPDYVFKDQDERLTTIFGRGSQDRIRVSPTGKTAYTVGVDNRIHVYDLDAGEMVAELEFPGGEGARVRDVAFSDKGDRLYAAATVNDKSTLFAVAEVSGADHKWRPVSVLCDVQLVTLGRPRGSKALHAVGKGTGLHSFDPDAEQVKPTLVHGFNAVGHLALDERRAQAYATVGAGEAATGRYASVVRVNLSGDPVPLTLPLTDPQGVPATGSDDIALVVFREKPRLYVVADAVRTGEGKRIVAYDLGEQPSPAGVAAGLEETELRLAYLPESEYLLVSHEDSFQIRLLDLEKNAMVPRYRHPVQISPMGLAVHPKGRMAYALNQVSNTINPIPADYLQPESKLDVEALARYRDAVLAAFIDLFGGFLQYLKDCFCDHFLVNCPECEGDEKIYLACVSVRGREVFRVCNFARRRYVKSFPTVGYWLSVLPVYPMVQRAMEWLCCSVPALFFQQREAPQSMKYEENVKASGLRKGMALMQATDLSGMARQFTQKIGLAGGVGTDWAKARLDALSFGPLAADRRARTDVTQTQVVGQDVAQASQTLEKARVEVVEVKEYDPSAAPQNLVRVAAAPVRLAPGERVELYQENGVVKYYARIRDVAAAPKSAAAEALPTETLQAAAAPPEVASVGALREELRARDEEIAALTARTAALEANLSELNALRERLQKFMPPE